MNDGLFELIESIYAAASGKRSAKLLSDDFCGYFNCAPARCASRTTELVVTVNKRPLYQAELLLVTVRNNPRPVGYDNKRHSNTNGQKIVAICTRESTSEQFKAWLEMEVAQQSFDEKAKATLLILAPHLEQALALHYQLQNRQATDQALIDKLLYLAPFPVVVLDRKARPRLINDAAAESVKGDGITLLAAGVRATASDENRRLQHLIKTVCNTEAASANELFISDILITRPSGKRPYCITLCQLALAKTTMDHEPAIILMIHDPEAGREIPYQRLQSLFSLTVSEARVATAIMQGKSLQECAASIGHSVSTSRNLLKRVFAKTDTCRQNQLTSLLAHSTLNQLPAAAREADSRTPVNL